MSPNLISLMETVSFSLTIGMTGIFEQRVERVADVEVARAVLEVVRGQQDLGGVAAVGLEGFVVGADESGLARGGGGLDVRQVARSAFELQQPDPGADGSAGDDDHPPARLPDLEQLLGQAMNAVDVERVIRPREGVRPDFDDDGLGGGVDLLTVRNAHGNVRWNRAELRANHRTIVDGHKMRRSGSPPRVACHGPVSRAIAETPSDSFQTRPSETPPPTLHGRHGRGTQPVDRSPVDCHPPPGMVQSMLVDSSVAGDQFGPATACGCHRGDGSCGAEFWRPAVC